MAATKLRLLQAIDTLYTQGPATHECYTRLVLECFRANNVDQAKKLQTHMDIHSYQPTDTFLQNRLLHLYAKSGEISHARNLFDKMPHRDIFSWNAMLSLYAKSGLVQDLRVFFDGMPSRDSVSYNTVISGFAKNGWAGKAVEAFVRMQNERFRPTEYTHVSVLNACTQLLDLRKGKQIHGRIVIGDYNLGDNAFIWNSLTDMYAKCGEIDRARWLFDRLPNKNVVSWNSMISGYLKNGQRRQCIDLFRKMQESGLKPDQVTVSSILNAYFQSGCIDEARELFNGIREKDKICWTTMMVGYTQNGKEDDALVLFSEMLKHVRPDSHTISSVVSSCAKLASLFHGQVIHGIALLMGINDDLLVSSAFVDMYCKCGVTSDAWAVFTAMPARSVVSWNAMIVGYAQNGQSLEALALYEKMLREDMRPDNITFVGVLSACIHAGLVDEGKRYFDSMSKLYGLIPTLDHFASMINLLGRSGSLDKAMELVTTMPHEPNSLIWSTVLSVSAKKGDVKHGEMAAKHLFELDPHNAAPYIMLSNMYAACGRWKDVASVRSLMKTKNVKKFAAYSWIEIDSEVHKFVADDRTHPDTKIIYEELDELIRKLKKVGFSPDTNLVLHDVGEDEKRDSISYHSEKLALAFGLIKKRHGPLRIIKNIRVCGDCHVFMKFASQITGRQIILRDSNRFHHFAEGKCSCNDYW
ncbi:putative pentatricopeptide repeat-containing protein At1g68930 [Mercurialis annua]|uniref:putative pentatricopeptide repeat-containing protein At1g68930 n=1 Tax=Mercurialis annua TaxID=3986 RepID=UPI00215EBA77|nr:putative pentatricopeptide repeat-containing protein At1g68930 [Mercurialis annua]XP_055961607.1 putative pentatricopeptide repeat-containing protein At1g68930 [Mercurialis annua]